MWYCGIESLCHYYDRVNRNSLYHSYLFYSKFTQFYSYKDRTYTVYIIYYFWPLANTCSPNTKYGIALNASVSIRSCLFMLIFMKASTQCSFTMTLYSVHHSIMSIQIHHCWFQWYSYILPVVYCCVEEIFINEYAVIYM